MKHKFKKLITSSLIALGLCSTSAIITTPILVSCSSNDSGSPSSSGTSNGSGNNDVAEPNPPSNPNEGKKYLNFSTRAFPGREYGSLQFENDTFGMENLIMNNRIIWFENNQPVKYKVSLTTDKSWYTGGWAEGDSWYEPDINKPFSLQNPWWEYPSLNFSITVYKKNNDTHYNWYDFLYEVDLNSFDYVPIIKYGKNDRYCSLMISLNKYRLVRGDFSSTHQTTGDPENFQEVINYLSTKNYVSFNAETYNPNDQYIDMWNTTTPPDFVKPNDARDFELSFFNLIQFDGIFSIQKI